MARCRFVQPEVVRLSFVDIHKRAHQRLITNGVPDGDKADPKKMRPATPEEVDRALARIADAEADGHWVDVKKHLNAGEHRRVFTRLVKDMTLGEGAKLDPDQVGMSKLAEYIVGWSLTDSNDRPVPFSEAAVRNLDAETYAELAELIDAHEEQTAKDREARKNDRAGAKPSPAISSSAA